VWGSEETKGLTPTSVANWYDTYWQYRQIFAVKGSPDGSLSNYQIKLTVHKASGVSNTSDVYLNSHSKDDFSDIRFTKSDGITLLNYWIEDVSSGNSATVWVKLDSIPVSPALRVSLSTMGTQMLYQLAMVLTPSHFSMILQGAH